MGPNRILQRITCDGDHNCYADPAPFFNFLSTIWNILIAEPVPGRVAAGQADLGEMFVRLTWMLISIRNSSDQHPTNS